MRRNHQAKPPVCRRSCSVPKPAVVFSPKRQAHLENVVFADVTEDDLRLYSDACFLNLFRISQLLLEYLLSVQDTLATSLEVGFQPNRELALHTENAVTIGMLFLSFPPPLNRLFLNHRSAVCLPRHGFPYILLGILATAPLLHVACGTSGVGY